MAPPNELESVFSAESGDEVSDTSDASSDANGDDDDEIAYENLELSAASSVTQEELQGDDTELYLIRLPSHSADERLVGRAVHENAPMGKGYHLRKDSGGEPLRAAFVVDGKLTFAKPFAKQFTVAFSTDLASSADTEQAPRSYPAPPASMKLQLRTVGSKKRNLTEMRDGKSVANGNHAKTEVGIQSDEDEESTKEEEVLVRKAKLEQEVVAPSTYVTTKPKQSKKKRRMTMAT